MKHLLCAVAVLFWLSELSLMTAQEKEPPDHVPMITQEKVPADYVPYDKAPEAIKHVQAVYPEVVRKDSLEGTVWLKVLVDEFGNIARVTIQKSDYKVFNQAAIEAVKQWTFKPAEMNGEPISVWVSIPFRFSPKRSKM